MGILANHHAWYLYYSGSLWWYAGYPGGPGFLGLSHDGRKKKTPALLMGICYLFLCSAVLSPAQLCPTLCDPVYCSPPGSSVHGDSLGKNTEVGCHALLQGILPIQGSDPGLPHCKQILYRLSHQGSPRILEWVVYSFSRESSQPRNWSGVSCIAARSFTSWASREAPLFLDPLEEGMATHSSILPRESPWTEEPAGLQSIGSQRVRHDWSNLAHTQLSLLNI